MDYMDLLWKRLLNLITHSLMKSQSHKILFDTTLHIYPSIHSIDQSHCICWHNVYSFGWNWFSQLCLQHTTTVINFHPWGWFPVYPILKLKFLQFVWFNWSWSDAVFLVSSLVLREKEGFTKHICVTREMRAVDDKVTLVEVMVCWPRSVSP